MRQNRRRGTQGPKKSWQPSWYHLCQCLVITSIILALISCIYLFALISAQQTEPQPSNAAVLIPLDTIKAENGANSHKTDTYIEPESDFLEATFRIYTSENCDDSDPNTFLTFELSGFASDSGMYTPHFLLKSPNFL